MPNYLFRGAARVQPERGSFSRGLGSTNRRAGKGPKREVSTLNRTGIKTDTLIDTLITSSCDLALRHIQVKPHADSSYLRSQGEECEHAPNRAPE
jgi:hypothetical protein